MTQKAKKTENKGLEPYRPSGWLSPFERMDDLFQEFIHKPLSTSFWPKPSLHRWLNEFEPGPTVDIFEEGGNVVVKSELPGMNKEDIEVNLDDGIITLSGEKKKEETIDKKNYYRHECSYGSFSRSFSLPSEVLADKAKASFKKGVLEVRIPKTQGAKKKAKKITIE